MAGEDNEEDVSEVQPKFTEEDSNFPENVNSGSQDEIPIWTTEGKEELAKIPFFVRGKVRRNTEKYALQVGCNEIDGETLLDAKAHFSK